MTEPVFTPDNEPYLGRASVFHYDQTIVSAMEVSTKVAAYTHAHREDLTPLQRAACEIIPQGVSLALSIRELVRQAYLFGALVLVRSLVERAAVVSHLEENPEAIALWKDGWRHRERPSLLQMLQAMHHDQPDQAKIVVDTLNHITHGDPLGADFNLVDLGDGGLGHAVGKVLNAPRLCDFICFQAYSYLIILKARAELIFPNA